MKQALAEGHAATAVTRHPEAFPLRDARLRVLGGDVFDRLSVEEAVAEQDAVLSTLGVSSSVSARAGSIRTPAWEGSSSGRS
jgi:putative NADH-flavin reductase